MGDFFYYIAYLIAGLFIFRLLICTFKFISKLFKGSKEYEVVYSKTHSNNPTSITFNDIQNTIDNNNQLPQYENIDFKTNNLLELRAGVYASTIIDIFFLTEDTKYYLVLVIKLDNIAGKLYNKFQISYKDNQYFSSQMTLSDIIRTIEKVEPNALEKGNSTVPNFKYYYATEKIQQYFKYLGDALEVDFHEYLNEKNDISNIINKRLAVDINKIVKKDLDKDLVYCFEFPKITEYYFHLARLPELSRLQLTVSQLNEIKKLKVSYEYVRQNEILDQEIKMLDETDKRRYMYIKEKTYDRAEEQRFEQSYIDKGLPLPDSNHERSELRNLRPGVYPITIIKISPEISGINYLTLEFRIDGYSEKIMRIIKNYKSSSELTRIIDVNEIGRDEVKEYNDLQKLLRGKRLAVDIAYISIIGTEYNNYCECPQETEYYYPLEALPEMTRVDLTEEQIEEINKIISTKDQTNKTSNHTKYVGNINFGELNVNKQLIKERIRDQHQDFLNEKYYKEHPEKLETINKIKEKEMQRKRKENSKAKQDAKEEKELLWAIREEKKENSRYLLGREHLVKRGYCNFYTTSTNHCTKYDFGPVHCTSYSNDYPCSWKERRLPDYSIKRYEDAQLDDIGFERRLTLFGKYYYEYDKFNNENFQDMLDFYNYLLDH